MLTVLMKLKTTSEATISSGSTRPRMMVPRHTSPSEPPG